MGSGPESRCAGRVYVLDGAVHGTSSVHSIPYGGEIGVD